MKKVYILSCTATKNKAGKTVQGLYTGPLFTKGLDYAKRHHADIIIVIGGKYKSDVFLLDNAAGFYVGIKISNLPIQKRKQLAKNRLTNILAKGFSAEEDTFVFLTGQSYYEFILAGRPNALPNALKNYELPFLDNNLSGIGAILHFLDNN